MPFIPDETPVKSPTPGFVPDSASSGPQTPSQGSKPQGLVSSAISAVQSRDSKAPGIFGFLGSMNKVSDAARYASAFATQGPIGLIGAYAATRPIQTLETASNLVKSTAKAGVQLTAQNPAVAEAFGAVGGPEARNAVLQPRNVPILGEVKPLSAAPEDVETGRAQGPGETALQAANMYLEAGAPGAGKLISKAVESVGPFSKWAKRFSTVPEDVINAAKNPHTAQEIAALRSGNLPQPSLPEIPNIPVPAKPIKVIAPDLGPTPGTPEELKTIGEKAFATAKGAEKSAMEMYGTTRESIIKAQEGKLIQRSKEFVKGAQDALSNEGIRVSGGKVNLVGSQFEGSETAKGFLQRAYQIMSRPVVRDSGKTVADDLLTRREALSKMIEGVPESERSLRRTMSNMVNSFDDTLDVILGPEAGQARAAYKTTMQATRPVIDAMTKIENGRQVFSQDKAYNFINSALKESKFDNTKLLSELDSVAKTANAEDVAKIEEGRAAYEKALEASKEAVARLNAQAKQAYDAAKTERARQLIEAKRMRDAAAATAKAELDGLKQLNASLSKISPEITDSLFSVVRRQMTNLPVLGNKLTPFFSPKFWGDIALSRGLKAAKTSPKAESEASRKFQLWLLSNMLVGSATKTLTEPVTQGQ